MPKPKSQPAANAASIDHDDPFAADLPPEPDEEPDEEPADEPDDTADLDDVGDPMLFVQPARLGALRITDSDVELDGVIEISWSRGASSATSTIKAMVRRKIEAEAEARAAASAISGALDVWREGTPSEGHEAISGTKVQRTSWPTQYAWVVYLVGETGVLPEAPRLEGSAPIKSGTVSANSGVVTLSLSVDFGPMSRRVLDVVEVLDGHRVLLVGRAAQPDLFSDD